MEEKRRFLRFDVLLNIEFKTPEGRDYYTAGLMRNFSRQGLSFITQQTNLSPNQDLELKFKLPNKDVLVACRGEIVWEEDKGKNSLVGIRLKEMDPYAKSEILEYAYNKWLTKMRDNN